MDIRNVDLNLLVVFDAMLEHRSVTRAGEAIGLSQPATSAAVARLRLMFEDPLFVKVGAQMQPTARAQALQVSVRRVIDAVKNEILQPAAFDPLRSERTFVVITPDIGEIHFVPPLIRRLAEAAPSLRLKAVSRPPDTAAEALASGAADLALGYFPDLKGAGFYQQKLFENRHVCMVRHDNPYVDDGPLSLDQYLALRHVVVRPDGREHVFEQFLARRGLRRQVALELVSFSEPVAHHRRLGPRRDGPERSGLRLPALREGPHPGVTHCVSGHSGAPVLASKGQPGPREQVASRPGASAVRGSLALAARSIAALCAEGVSSTAPSS